MRPKLTMLKPPLAATTAKPLWSPDAKRGNRHERGYGTEWDKTRERIFERDDHLCQPHLKQGETRYGNEVDHIVGKAEARALGWTTQQIEADANLQTICTTCHLEKSRGEMKAANA